MTDDEYNLRELQAGAVAPGHISELARVYQAQHGLAVDGKLGPATRAHLLAARAKRNGQALVASVATGTIEKVWPLPILADGRKPVITSGYRTKSRPSHDGVDLFYPWLDSDPDMPLGDGGAIKRDGKRRWWYPPGAVAVAAAAGRVTIAGYLTTGWRCWVDHGNGQRTGYFHGARLLVAVGHDVRAGDPVIEVGHNPQVHDARHLHFEVSSTKTYAPIDPRPWLEGAGFVRGA